jgi:hypothetical protein
VGSGTSSDAGTVVSHRPIRPSQDDVRRCVPPVLDDIDETGAVWRWSDERAFEEEGISRLI